jgi:hypothetical protein
MSSLLAGSNLQFEPDVLHRIIRFERAPIPNMPNASVQSWTIEPAWKDQKSF